MGFFDRFSKKKESVLPKEDDSKNFGYDPSMYELTDDNYSVTPPKEVYPKSEKNDLKEETTSYGGPTDQLDDLLNKSQQQDVELAELTERIRESKKETEKQNKELSALEGELQKGLKEKATRLEKESSDWTTDITARMAQLDHAPGAQRAKETAAKEAGEIFGNIKDDTFKDKLSETFDRIQQYVFVEEMGLKPNDKQIESLVLEGKERLRYSYGEDRSFSAKDLLLPYLVEKEAIGILSDKEQQLLSEARSKGTGFEFAQTLLAAIYENAPLLGVPEDKITNLFEKCEAYMVSEVKKHENEVYEQKQNAIIDSWFEDDKKTTDSLEEGKKHR